MEKWYVVGLISAIVLAGVAFYTGKTSERVLSGVTPGLDVTVATSSQQTLGTTAKILFSTSTCATRIVSTTGASGVMLTFTDKQGYVPSGEIGHFQAASTTVSYDGSVYGCGTMRGYSFVEQKLWLSEGR